MKKLCYILFLVVIVILSLVFIYFNPQQATLNFAQLGSYTTTIGLLLLMVFVGGIIIGAILMMPSNLKLRSRLSKARKAANSVDSSMS